MIPWYVYAGTAALLILGYVVNRANLLFMIGAMAAAAMIVPTVLGLSKPLWLELLVIFPALCLILAFIAGPPSASESIPSEGLPDGGGPVERLSNDRSE